MFIRSWHWNGHHWLESTTSHELPTQHKHDHFSLSPFFCPLLVISILQDSSILLDINRTIDKIAQAYKNTQRHINNAWSEMVSYSPCIAFYCFSSFHWFVQTIWDNSHPSLDYHYSLIITSLFLLPLPLYFYWLRAIYCSTSYIFMGKHPCWFGVSSYFDWGWMS